MQGVGSLVVLPLLRTEEPGTVLDNGNIVTMDEAQPRAQAAAISGARFVAVGSNAEVLPLASAHGDVLHFYGQERTQHKRASVAAQSTGHTRPSRKV